MFMLIYKRTTTRNKQATEIKNKKITVSNASLSCLFQSWEHTQLVQCVVHCSITTNLVPTYGLWITALLCTIQHNHIGHKGMRLMAPATLQLLGQSSQILTNGLISICERSHTMLTLKDISTCHSMICQTSHARGQKGQCSAPPARQATPSAPQFTYLPTSLSQPHCIKQSPYS